MISLTARYRNNVNKLINKHLIIYAFVTSETGVLYFYIPLIKFVNILRCTIIQT